MMLIVPLFFVCSCKDGGNVAYDVIEKVADFEGVRQQGIEEVAIGPLKLGPDRQTVGRSLHITDEKIAREIVDHISFQDSPKLPEAMHHSGLRAGCVVTIKYQSGQRYSIVFLLRKGLAGQGVEYKMSALAGVTEHDADCLARNGSLGHGYSVELHKIIRRATSRAAGGKDVWTPSRW
jgi:hypothetical protein